MLPPPMAENTLIEASLVFLHVFPSWLFFLCSLTCMSLGRQVECSFGRGEALLLSARVQGSRAQAAAPRELQSDLLFVALRPCRYVSKWVGGCPENDCFPLHGFPLTQPERAPTTAHPSIKTNQGRREGLMLNVSTSIAQGKEPQEL